jgi:CRP-like cAMP-binding protein
LIPAVVENHLIELLPRKDRLRLLALCEPVQLRYGEVLTERGDATSHAYFPIDAFVSLLKQVDEHPGMEVAMVGREGFVGLQLVLGQTPAETVAPLRSCVQGPGRAWRIGAAAFKEELQTSEALQKVLKRYLNVSLSQLANSAACVRFHLIGPRLARWLLMSQDHAHADQFHVTHEFLAYLLGVRRVGITVAAGALQQAGLIAYHRGALTVLDRAGLEAAACSCYAADASAYRVLMG